MFVDLSLNPREVFGDKISEAINKPKIIKVNKFTEESAKEFNKDFNEAIEGGQSIIPVVIDSYGGDVFSAFSIIDTIKSSPVKVATISTGKAMSAGAFLLSAGEEGMRWASPNAVIMIHELSSFLFGKNEEIQADANQVKKLNKKLFEIMSLNCNHPKKYFEKIYRKEKARADWYLSPKEAKKHNLINHIGMPKITMKVNVDIGIE